MQHSQRVSNTQQVKPERGQHFWKGTVYKFYNIKI